MGHEALPISKFSEVIMERLLTPHQLADFLGVKPGTIYSWLSRGVDIPPPIKIGSVTRWQEKTVRQWIEAREKERKRRNFEL
jgi:predicted DNA-binding transcriptional regulator AlpA